MQIIADLHIHSKYSRAVSQKMDLYEISDWAKKKGINLAAIPDWTHPIWFRQIAAQLKEISEGIYSLSKDKNDTRFLFSTELSSIYTQNGQVRRIHNVVFSPSLQTCERVIRALQKQGANLMSDGRPILGISAKELIELLLTIDENILLVPAHAWTPWFSLYGSKSGFDSINECFGNFANEIYAVETGLSSDPIMNWQIKELEHRSILSFSDAHSGAKLGREATVFVQNSQPETRNSQLSYFDIIDAIKQKPLSKLRIGYTIEFFPEEGKYHWSGHRVCNIRYNALEVKEKGEICPVCKKPLTIGVENRVLDLSEKVFNKKDLSFAKNSVGLTFVSDKNKKRRPFVSLIQLHEALVEITKSQVKADREYERLVSDFASEFDILLKKSYEEIEQAGGPLLKNAIKKIRERNVFVDPGYDGVFGKVKIFQDEQKIDEQTQTINTENQPKLF
jgi:uncharacterized protein (TIGR00375 family)